MRNVTRRIKALITSEVALMSIMKAVDGFDSKDIALTVLSGPVIEVKWLFRPLKKCLDLRNLVVSLDLTRIVWRCDLKSNF